MPVDILAPKVHHAYLSVITCYEFNCVEIELVFTTGEAYQILLDHEDALEIALGLVASVARLDETECPR